ALIIHTSLPYTTLFRSNIGDFPFFTLPEGLKSMNKPFERKFDVCFFPINGIMTPKEGKLYKIFVTNNPGEEYSKHYFEKSMEDRSEEHTSELKSRENLV